MENLRIKIQAELRKYINDKHNQDECSGFIDGIDAVFELLKSEGYKDINTSEPQVQQADVSWRSELLLDFVSTMKGIKPNWNCDQMIERINDYYK